MKTVGVKEARLRLARLIRAAEKGEQFVITRHGSPAAILLGLQHYASLIATVEEMADPGALRALRAAQADAKAGRIHTYEDFQRLLGHSNPSGSRTLRLGGRWRGTAAVSAQDLRNLRSEIWGSRSHHESRQD